MVHQWSFLLFCLSFDCFWYTVNWYTVGTVFVHQWLFLCCFDCVLTVLTIGTLLVHCLYSLGRPVTIGTPMVFKRQSKQQKSPLVYQSSHDFTESAEYTKPRKRRYLARPLGITRAWAVATASRPWAELTLCVYMDVHASGSRSLPRAATLY